ncbi:MAG: KTSC domain-containing protein [Lachnospiraceae bacterium]
MKRHLLITEGIKTAGYDALCAVLELELQPDGKIWRFYDVPEEIWYAWKGESMAVTFFNRNIACRFEAEQIE